MTPTRARMALIGFSLALAAAALAATPGDLDTRFGPTSPVPGTVITEPRLNPTP